MAFKNKIKKISSLARPGKSGNVSGGHGGVKVGEPGGQGLILVVDQDDWCRDFLCSVIKLLRCGDFHLVASVPEGLTLMEEMVFDLIITDHKLPDFHRLVDLARSRYPLTQIILLVQQRHQPHPVFFLEQVELVIKPPSLDDMVRKIRHALHQKQLRQTEEEWRRLRQEAFRLFLG
jgi:DNA-binding NtrC family response regulator